jgi:hypothetical protein
VGRVSLGKTLSLDTLKQLTAAYRNVELAIGLFVLVPSPWCAARRLSCSSRSIWSRARFDVGLRSRAARHRAASPFDP